MENVRIVQKNLVFVSGMSASIADVELLKTNEYFGRYGKVNKIVTNLQQPLKKPCTYQAYVTYSNSIEAAIAITALNGFNINEKPLKVSFGTTKYCAHFLRGYDCLNADCFYLHMFDKKNQVLNKETKIIFEQQNEEAINIIYENLEEIVEKIVQNEQQTTQSGFPSMMEMMEFLVQSNIISQKQLKSLMKKYKQLTPPKLILTISSPPCFQIKTDSPKQNTLKLTKSNSFSTIASPYKSQTETYAQTLKKFNEEQKNIGCIGQKQNQEKTIKAPKIEKNQKINSKVYKPIVEQPNQIDNVQKNFLKYIVKVNERSKSKMSFARQIQCDQIYRIKEIIQKYLIISN